MNSHRGERGQMSFVWFLALTSLLAIKVVVQ